MKAQKLYFILFLWLGCLPFCEAQQDDLSITNPNEQYEVHREYDENGNLIYYDSVAVSAYGYDSTEIDSLLDAWEFGKPNELHPFYYGFHFPDDPFGYMPGLEFDFVIPDLHDFNEGFEYGFSLTPRDSLYSPVFPADTIYHHQHIFPPFDIDADIEERLYQMQQYMEEFHERMMEHIYRTDPYLYGPAPVPNDSIDSEDVIPSPSENSYYENTINI